MTLRIEYPDDRALCRLGDVPATHCFRYQSKLHQVTEHQVGISATAVYRFMDAKVIHMGPETQVTLVDVVLRVETR